MKLFPFTIILAVAVACWLGTGCGHEHSHDGDTTEHSHDGHDHDGHDHDGHDHAADHDTLVTSNANSKVAHGDGSQYTAYYVCPMHCKGSGGNEPGKCPVCGMDYVRFSEHIRDGHHHRTN